MVLLVPGTSGCKLMRDHTDIGWPGLLTLQAWTAGSSLFAPLLDLERVRATLGFSSEELVALLSMEHAESASTLPTKTTLLDGAQVGPGPILRAAYNQFTFDEFRYDWRADIRLSGKLLLDYLMAHERSNGRATLLAHSQGGLVVVAAAHLAAVQANPWRPDYAAFSRWVSHASLVATPLLGTMNAADALLNGQNLADGFATHFRKIVRTWPSIHQMLPAWPGAVCIESGSSQKTPAPYSMLDDVAWAGHKIDPDMLVRARAFRRRFLRYPLLGMRGVKTQLILTRGHPTRTCAVRTDTGLVLDAGVTEPGDALVPALTTFAGLNDEERRVSFLLGGEGDTAVHFMLMNDPAVATTVRKFFES